ncbi:MAG: uroporphyrinogen-III C-methyltransferase [Pseudomonadota bacterium]
MIGEKPSETTADKPGISDKNAEKPLNVSADEHQPTVDQGLAATAPDQKTKAATPPLAEKKRGKKTGLLMFIFFLVLICAALALATYYGWQFWLQQDQRLQSLESRAQQQVNALNTLSAEKNNQASDQQALIARINQDQQAIQQTLSSHTRRLRALAGTSRDDWLLAEARYLLRLANQRLLVEKGTESALGLLQSADGIIQSINDDGLLPVRSAIANEIVALKLAKTIDRQGVFLQIGALKNRIRDLPMVPTRQHSTERSLPSSSSDSLIKSQKQDLSWYQSLGLGIQSALSKLSDFVKVRRYDEVPTLLISEQQQLQIANNLTFMFEQAQFALLHQQQKIYHYSLQQAIDWWNSYYAHYAEYEIVSDQLKTLQAMSVEQQFPDISGSSALLTDYIERFHQLNSSPAQADPSANTAPSDNAPSSLEDKNRIEQTPATEGISS